jgi:HEAT repeat protein
MTPADEQYDNEVKQALEEMQSENPRLRSAAVARLGELRAGLSAIQDASTDRNGYVRAAAAEAMGNFPASDVSLYLGDLLFDDNPFVRSAAVRSLGKVGASEYVGTLVDFLDDSNPHIRAAALRALSDLHAPEATELLVEGLSDPHRKLRLDAARGLSQLADPDTRPRIEEALLEALRQPRADLPFVNTLIQAYARSGAAEEVGPVLVRLLQEAVGCRTVAARALRPLQYEPARRTLERALTDRNPNLRYASLRALEELGAGPSMAAIRQLLEDEDSRVQRAACQILILAGDREILPILQEMVFSPNPFLRPRAVEGVAQLDPEGSRSLLIELLQDNNIAVRTAAIDALARYRHIRDVRRALEQAREDEVTERVRQHLDDLLDSGPAEEAV